MSTSHENQFSQLPVVPNSDYNTSAAEYYERAYKQVSRALVGEDEAIAGYVAATISGLPVVLLGPPGGGKSVLLDHGHRLIDGIGENGRAFIPPQSDLTGKEMTGGTHISDKAVKEADGAERSETTTIEYEGILTPDTQVVIADEINRANPTAVGAIFRALEGSEIVNNTGIVALRKLIFAALAINPRGTDRTVYPMSSALVSRMGIGVDMGNNPNTKNAIIGAALRGEIGNPKDIKTVTDTTMLQRYRMQAEAIGVSPEEFTRIGHMVRVSHDLLTECGIKEAVGRPAVQIKRIAGALAIMSGSSVINAATALQALKFQMVAHIGATEVREDPHAVFNSLLDSVRATEKERASWFVSRTHATK